MPLHVTAHAESFPATGVGTFVRFLARMRVGVDFQTARSAEGFVAGRADVSVLRLREDGLGVLVDVVVVLPDVAVLLAGHRLDWHRGLGWEV